MQGISGEPRTEKWTNPSPYSSAILAIFLACSEVTSPQVARILKIILFVSFSSNLVSHLIGKITCPSPIFLFNSSLTFSMPSLLMRSAALSPDRPSFLIKSK